MSGARRDARDSEDQVERSPAARLSKFADEGSISSPADKQGNVKVRKATVDDLPSNISMTDLAGIRKKKK